MEARHNLSRSERAPHTTNRLLILITMQCDILLLDNEYPLNYMDVVMGLDYEKRLGATSFEIESVYDNQVWKLVDPLDGVQTINCKWIFRKY